MSPHQTIAHYRIVSKLGEGGMGEVWRARDTKLNRDVAIKVLPATLAGNAQYMARFEREAQTLAALNHPNIASVYGVEQGAIVMELVDGETLAQRIARGPIPLDEVLPIARQIAEGLEAAHERGIVHRDLKPANVKITSSGVVKLLDFGLAKAEQENAAAAGAPNSISPTLSLEMTQAGYILGTAAYMSPEQAAGKPVDKRADVWAYGVVLYELLMGRQLFGGDNVSHILAGVLKDPIDLSPIPQTLRPLLARCLDRDVRTRLRDIGEARIWLSRPQPEPAAVAAAPAAALRRAWVATGVCALCLAVPALIHFREEATKPPGPVRFEVAVPPSVFVGRSVSLSPDGSTMAWSDAANIYLRAIDGFEPRVLTAGALLGQLFWSPDSKQLGFLADGRLKRIPVAGGPAQTICERVRILGTVWTKDDMLIMGGDARGLLRVPVSGGKPEPVKLTGVPGNVTSFSFPVLLPRGNRLLFTAVKSQGPSVVLVADFQSDGSLVVSRELIIAEHGVQYFTDAAGRGHLLFVRDAGLIAQAFDADSATLSGEPW
jgi:protein kinase-like protein